MFQLLLRRRFCPPAETQSGFGAAAINSKCNSRQTHINTLFAQKPWGGVWWGGLGWLEVGGGGRLHKRHLAHIRTSRSRAADILLPCGNFSGTTCQASAETLIHTASYSSRARTSVSPLPPKNASSRLGCVCACCARTRVCTLRTPDFSDTH